jgi:ankyrin repeat protein
MRRAAQPLYGHAGTAMRSVHLLFLFPHREIMSVSALGSQNVVSFLLEKGADLEAQSFGGLRPLHHACNNSKEGIIGKLLDAGANPNARDDNDNTSLHWAAARFGS